MANFIAVIALVALVPSYMALRDGAHSIVAQAGSVAASSSVADAVAEARDLITLSEQVTATSTSAVDYMRLAISLRPTGTTLSSVNYVRNTSGSQILLSGTSLRTSDIESYRKALVATGKFLQVNVPVDSLAGTTNGRFSITLTE